MADEQPREDAAAACDPNPVPTAQDRDLGGDGSEDDFGLDEDALGGDDAEGLEAIGVGATTAGARADAEQDAPEERHGTRGGGAAPR